MMASKFLFFFKQVRSVVVCPKKFCYQQQGYIGIGNPRTFKGIF